MCYLYSMCTHTQVYCMWSHWHDVSLPQSPQFLCHYEWRIPLLKHHQTLTDPDSLTWWLKYTLWWGDSSADCSPVTADHIHSNTRAASSVPLVLLFPEKNISFTSDSIASDFKDFAFKQHTKLYYCASVHLPIVPTNLPLGRKPICSSTHCSKGLLFKKDHSKTPKLPGVFCP